MIWGGETVYTTWGYQPLTEWAVSYGKTADHYPAPRDRGVAQDVYAARVLFQGPLAELEDLEGVLAGNRQAFNITCSAGEEIFGAEVNYSGALSVTAKQAGRIDRAGFPLYAMPIELRLLSPSFQAVTPGLDALRLASWRYGAYSTFTNTKRFSMSGAASYLDHNSDVGVFEGEFTQTTAEMRAIRRALLSTVRGQAIQFPDFGITKPFGQRRSDRQWLKTHVLEWEDLGRENFTDWRLRIYFAEAYPYFSGGSEVGDTLGDHLTGGTSGEPDLHGVPPEA